MTEAPDPSLKEGRHYLARSSRKSKTTSFLATVTRLAQLPLNSTFQSVLIWKIN